MGMQRSFRGSRRAAFEVRAGTGNDGGQARQQARNSNDECLKNLHKQHHTQNKKKKTSNVFKHLDQIAFKTVLGTAGYFYTSENFLHEF